jgi:hypothetical protein
MWEALWFQRRIQRQTVLRATGTDVAVHARWADPDCE